MRKVIALFIFLLGVFWASSATAAEKWLRLSSEHFEMLSCTSEKNSRKLLLQLEQFRAAFLQVFPLARVYENKPLIFIFDTNKQFKPYKLQLNGKPTDHAGYFMPGLLDSRIGLYNGSFNQGLEIIFHEYIHALVAAGGWEPPLFVNEGLAEVFATFKVSGDKVTLGRADEYYVGLLLEEGLMPFGAFFAVGHDSKYYNESAKASIFYAQSWLLMHYIIWGNSSTTITAENLSKFLDLSETSGMTVSDAFQQAFRIGYPELESALSEYLNGGEYRTRQVTIPAQPIKDRITCRPAADDERDLELIGLKWRALEPADTKLKLLQYIDKHPDDPRPYEILSEVEIRDGEARMASEYWKKAAERGSKNPMVYSCLLHELYSDSDLALDYVMSEGMSRDHRMWVDRLIELAPRYPEAYELLALIEAQSPEIRVSAVNRAITELGSLQNRERILAALAICYWRLGRYTQAEVIAQSLMNDRNTSDYAKDIGNELFSRRMKQKRDALYGPNKDPKKLQDTEVPDLKDLFTVSSNG